MTDTASTESTESTGAEDPAGDDATSRLQFVQFHSPGLLAGSYRITVQQTVNVPAPATFTAERTFAVGSERFSLAPAEVHAVFPPDGSLGDHSNTLPHVVLERSTLPWERTADPVEERLSWLAVLLFTEEEAPKPATAALSELMSPSGYQYPAFELEPGQKADDRVTVIDVARSLLEAIVPTAAELALQAHVRVGLEGSTPTGEGVAVLMGSRLPAAGARSVAHLVSVEGRYAGGAFDYGGAKSEELVRLVTLASWSFACADPDQSFKGLLEHLDRAPAVPRLPPTGVDAADGWVERGYVLLPHVFRGGGRSVAWYRGPLAPAAHDVELEAPVRAADALLRYDASAGVFDVSYAAAWEVGRLLALQSRDVSVAMYGWKRASSQQLRGAEQSLLHPELPLPPGEEAPPPAPESVTAWFDGLRLLRGVPFNYLVPDERMLPREGIRFFHLDHFWVDCLLDGAFSIGRVAESEAEREASFAEDPSDAPLERVTGFLLRSDVVSGWPGLLVDGRDAAGGALPLLRMDRLSASVLLCLFAGDVAGVALHLRPETLHFGLDRGDEAEPQADVRTEFHKVLRDTEGVEQPELRVDPVPFRGDGSRRVVDVAALASAMEKVLATPLTSASFGLQMVEGVEEVVFHRG
jgi:hypothetical protein